MLNFYKITPQTFIGQYGTFFFLNTLSHDLHMITLFAYNQPIDTFGIYISQPHARLTENHPLYKF